MTDLKRFWAGGCGRASQSEWACYPDIRIAERARLEESLRQPLASTCRHDSSSIRSGGAYPPATSAQLEC